MSEPESSSVVGAVSNISGRLITALPTQFLVLVLMNTVFILGLLWFLEKQSASRERVLLPIMTACLQQSH